MTTKHVSLPPPKSKFDPASLPASSFQAPGGPGIQGRLPLPSTPITASSLTEQERAMLVPLGWKDGDAVPGNLPSLLEEAQRSAAESMSLDHLPPPVDPRHAKPLEVPPLQQLADLQPADRQRITEALKRANVEVKDTWQPGGPGVSEAAAGHTHREVNLEPQIVDDRAKPAPSAQTAAPIAPAQCPHCSWDLNTPDDAEPTDDDKQSFLLAAIAPGNQPWQKIYRLFEGRLAVTVRQLRVEEVDACYDQAFHERNRGKLANALEFWEILNRYKAALQIVDVRSDQDITTLPESLKDWGGEPEDGDPTILPQIVRRLDEEVAGSESRHRILRTTVARFNRLAAKLEAHADSPGFYSATGTPT